MTGTLVVEDLNVRYGSRVAVEGVSFRAEPGDVLGLIGPNGAGKTSVLNACSGLVKALSGRVVLDGADIGGLAPAARARRGLGRTFQRSALFESLPVLDNVMLGWEAGQATCNPLRHLFTPRQAGTTSNTRTAEAMQLCGIERLARRAAADLTTAERKLVELARIVAGDFSVLLLDEPSSGLDHGEKERFGEVLAQVVQARDLTVVVVEHDMSVVAEVCDEVVVIDGGHVVHRGPPVTLRDSDTVRRVYLSEAGTWR